MIEMDVYSGIGFVGMILVVSAYAYLTAKDEPNLLILHGTNLAGATLLAISLLIHTNLPSLVLEVIWMGVAIWGLTKAFLARRKAQ